MFTNSPISTSTISVCKVCGAQKQDLLCPSCGSVDVSATNNATDNASSQRRISINAGTVTNTGSLYSNHTGTIGSSISSLGGWVETTKNYLKENLILTYADEEIVFSSTDVVLALREKYPEKFV